MIARLILTIITLVIIAFFAGLNLENKCDLWLFYTFKGVPVFFTVIFSFIAGILFTIPFAFFHRKNKKQTSPKEKKQSPKIFFNNEKSSSNKEKDAQNDSKLQQESPTPQRMENIYTAPKTESTEQTEQKEKNEQQNKIKDD